jgi:two-component system alkaline phosphatase synthesis response regulator PhoP
LTVNSALQQVKSVEEPVRRILVADDDMSMRMLLAGYLRRLGYEVVETESGEDALRAALAQRFDCFIFDVTMPPGMTGLELLRRLRERDLQTPTLFLTALNEIDNKVAGFQAGGDDYLAKPFEPRELEVRLEALMRRTGTPKEPDGRERIQIGDLVIDKRRHEVTREGAIVDLTPLEFQILARLASEPGRAWSRNDLLDQVWSTDYEGYQRNVDPHINRLRQKIEPDPKNPRYVLTVRGVGYKLNDAI